MEFKVMSGLPDMMDYRGFKGRSVRMVRLGLMGLRVLVELPGLMVKMEYKAVPVLLGPTGATEKKEYKEVRG